MPTLTIRNVPVEVVDRLKAAARRNGRSMEQELRELLESRYATKADILERVKKSWEELPPTSASEVNEWLRNSRYRDMPDGD